jgi:sigma-B regulation protein RsbU (phosphoserine phosphatase)
MIDKPGNIFQIGEALEERLGQIEDKLEEQINKIVDLSRIGTAFTSLLDLDIMLPMLIETALRFVKGEVGEVTIFAAEGQSRSVSWGLSAEISHKLKSENGEPIIEAIRKGGESIVINNFNYQCETGVQAHEVIINSLIVAPLKSQSQVVGAIAIANKENDGDFDADDAFALEMLGSFAAVAVSNVRLHREALMNQKLEHELRLAEQVQQTLMPEKHMSFEGLEINAFQDQAGQVGGDLFDVIQMGDGRYLIVVADVSNKGMPAALIMASVHSYIRVIAESVDSISGLVSRINNFLCNDVQRLGGMFVTLFAGLIDLKEGQLISVNAAHPPGFLIRSNHLEKLKTGGTLLGQFPDFIYEEKTTPIVPGDRLIIFTDGIFECVDARGQMMGLGRLGRFFKQHRRAAWSEFVEHLKDILDEYSFDKSRVDDSTLLMVEVK